MCSHAREPDKTYLSACCPARGDAGLGRLEAGPHRIPNLPLGAQSHGSLNMDLEPPLWDASLVGVHPACFFSIVGRRFSAQ